MSRRLPPAPMLSPHTDWSLKRPVQGRRHFSAPAGVEDDPAPSDPSAFRPTAYSLQPTASSRRALTLIEMLVALAVTLVMMAAVVNLFANISGSIRNRRAVIEVSGQLRQARQRLALDLAGATCSATTWQRPGEDPGYIEIIEGRWNDADPSVLTDGDITATNLELDYATSLVPSGGDPRIVTSRSAIFNGRAIAGSEVTNGGGLGDWDDILALTVQSETLPFKAQVGGNLIESTYAEVLWYAGENPQDDPATPGDETLLSGTRLEPGMRRIYRRAYLIAPWLGPWDYTTSGDNGRPRNVSVRFVPGSAPNTGQWVANTLGDLTKRENRACRAYDPAVPMTSVFPHLFTSSFLDSDAEFLLLADALAFDVRVFDPGAPLRRNPPPPPSGPDVPFTALQPGDPGWAAAQPDFVVGYGAYCDLGWGWDDVAGSWIYGPAAPAGAPQANFNQARPAGFHPAMNNAIAFPAVYDTWSYHYENDGFNTDLLYAVDPSWQFNTIDQGANGLDDDGANGVDDPGERETSPPYDVPLRGVKVSLRIYERDARQIRETSVTHSFAE